MERLVELLKILNHIPHEFLDIEAKEINQLFESPTILYEKSKLPPLFVSTLLHGNETSSLTAIQRYLKANLTLKRERGLAILIGNPKAANKGLRHLSNQLDYNRIWKDGSSLEHSIAKQVKKFISENTCYAAIDLHNNTGKNPIYGCVNRKKLLHVRLAECFSNHLVYFTEPESVFSVNINEYCPTITCECGLSGDEKGIEAAINLINKLMDEKANWMENPIINDSALYTFATVYVSRRAKIDFSYPDSKNVELSFTSNLDELNFQTVPVNTNIAYIRDPKLIKVINNYGENIFDQIFIVENNILKNITEIIPSMFTKDVSIAKSDALGYLMTPYSLKHFK